MPNIEVPAFVLGAVFLLLAVAGAAFQLFGPEPTKPRGKGLRVASFFLGVAFILIGIERWSSTPPHAPDHAFIERQ
jgi:hypothetical protein